MTNVNPNGAVPFFEEYLTDLSLRTIIYRGDNCLEHSPVNETVKGKIFWYFLIH